jgi:RNA polymerase sigma factor (sigma-70 family)
VVTESSDEELLVAIARGPGAIAEFYRRHVARVTGMGVRRFDNPEDVADFVGNVLLAVLTSASGFDPARGRAVSWLYGVGTNVASAMYRQRGRTAHAERRISGRALLDSNDYARVEERIDAATELRRTYLAIQQLSQSDRELLELVAIDGLDAREAASVVGVTPVTARVRLSRARNRLRAALDQQQIEREMSALHIVKRGIA